MEETTQQVTDPKEPNYIGPTNKFDPKITIYDDGEFIIAQGTWKEEDKDYPSSYAMRWYSGDGLGYPNGFGRPQWMACPDHIGQTIHIDQLKVMLDTRKKVA